MQKLTVIYINNNLKIGSLNNPFPLWLPNGYLRQDITFDLPYNHPILISFASNWTLNNYAEMVTFIAPNYWKPTNADNTVKYFNENGEDITDLYKENFNNKGFGLAINQRINPLQAVNTAINSWTEDGNSPYDTLPYVYNKGIFDCRPNSGLNIKLGSVDVISNNPNLYIDYGISYYSDFKLPYYDTYSVFPKLTHDNKNVEVIQEWDTTHFAIVRHYFLGLLGGGTDDVKNKLKPTPIKQLKVDSKCYNYNMLADLKVENSSLRIDNEDILFDIYADWNNNTSITESNIEQQASVVFIGKNFNDIDSWVINYGQVKEILEPTLIPFVKPRIYIRCREKNSTLKSNYVFFDIDKNGDVDTSGTLETNENGILTINVIYDEPLNNNEDYGNTPNINDIDGDIYDTPHDVGLGVFNTLYIMSKEQLKTLGETLWSGSIFDNFELLNNSPLENIISCKLYPFTLTGGAQSTIKIGNVQFSATGYKYNSAIASINCGSVFIGNYFNNFLDREPFTKLTIYLPFIGYKDLNVEQYIGKTLSVKYNVDLITGTCEAVICANTTVCNIYNGTIGIDIPISASNRAQIENGFINSLIKSAISGNISNAITSTIDMAMCKNSYSTDGNPTPCASLYNPLYCYCIIDRPTAIGSKPTEKSAFIPSQSFRHTYGMKCNLQLQLKYLQGYTKISKIDLSSLKCSEYEKEEIKRILNGGIYI